MIETSRPVSYKPADTRVVKRCMLLAAALILVVLATGGAASAQQAADDRGSSAAPTSAEFVDSNLNWIPSVVIRSAPASLPAPSQDDFSESGGFTIHGTGDLPEQALILTLTTNSNPLTSGLADSRSTTLAGGFWQLGQALSETTESQSATGSRLGWQLHLTDTTSQGNLPGDTDQLALATIQCANGQLTGQSVIASGCRFTDVDEGNLNLAVGYEPVNGLQARAGVFASQQSNPAPWRLSNTLNNQALANMLGGNIGTGNLFGLTGTDSSGVQLGLSVTLPTGQYGQLQLDADYARTVDYQLNNSAFSGFESTFNDSNNLLTRNNDLDSARLQLGWSNGRFSGGIESLYQETPLVPGLSNGADLTTFNVEFTWHTPWHGALSVGASNLMDAGNEQPINSNDQLDSIYGRIPYVRYKQDLN